MGFLLLFCGVGFSWAFLLLGWVFFVWCVFGGFYVCVRLVFCFFKEQLSLKYFKGNQGAWMRWLCNRSYPMTASPLKGPHTEFRTEMLRLQYYHQSQLLTTPHHTLAARADNPVKQHQASNAPCPLLLRVVSSFISRASLHKQEFHSREVLQVCQQQCLPPPTQTCFLGAKQVQVQ